MTTQVFTKTKPRHPRCSRERSWVRRWVGNPSALASSVASSCGIITLLYHCQPEEGGPQGCRSPNWHGKWAQPLVSFQHNRGSRTFVQRIHWLLRGTNGQDVLASDSLWQFVWWCPRIEQSQKLECKKSGGTRSAGEPSSADSSMCGIRQAELDRAVEFESELYSM